MSRPHPELASRPSISRALFATPILFAAILARPASGNPAVELTGQNLVPEGLSTEDWSSIRSAYEAGRHAFEPVGEGWRARNIGQQWTTYFDGRGFRATPDEGGWSWGLELRSYGFGTQQFAVTEADEIVAEGQRLVYRRDQVLEEWWVNDHRGLEHGFVVSERPEADRDGKPLAFHLATLGGLAPRVTPDGLGVVFEDADGVAALTYGGLKVWDAEGRILPSRFEEGGAEMLRLLVDDHGAVYPVTVDPIAQQAYLKAGNADAGDQFGRSVAVSGDTVVVGAWGEASNQTGVTNGPGGSTDNSAGGAGAAYVFVRSGSNWSQQAYLKPGNTGAGDWFGLSVAISGDTVVVGAFGEDSNQTGVTNGSGGSVDESATDAGAAYVFVRSGTNWSQQAYLKAGNTGANDQFGYSVAVAVDTVVVGAYGEDSNQTGVTNGPGGSTNDSASTAGATYVFVRSGINWSQQAYLKAGNTGAYDEFGYSVAVSDDTVVVGARQESSNQTGVTNGPGGSADESAYSAGAAYVFVRSGTNWSQQAYLKAGNTGSYDLFGASVAVSGDTAVVGAYWESSNQTGVTNGIGGSTDNSASLAGAAYVFVRSGTNWSQQAYLKAGNTGAGDYFGDSVAVSGDIVVVAAPKESSNQTWVTNGPGGSADNSSFEAGAAYVFERSGTNWSQQAYLKAGNTRAGDYFGTSVAVSGDTVVVGARWEDSGGTGVTNGPGGSVDNSAESAGAAYVFDLNAVAPTAPPGLTLSKPRFPATAVRKRSRPQTVTVTNTGGSLATGLSASLSGSAKKDFVLTPINSAPLVAGATRTVKVTFAPKRKRLRRATLTVRSNVPAATTMLSGIGR